MKEYGLKRAELVQVLTCQHEVLSLIVQNPYKMADVWGPWSYSKN